MRKFIKRIAVFVPGLSIYLIAQPVSALVDTLQSQLEKGPVDSSAAPKPADLTKLADSFSAIIPALCVVSILIGIAAIIVSAPTRKWWKQGFICIGCSLIVFFIWANAVNLVSLL